MNILLLCEQFPATGGAGTIVDHVDSFLNYSKHRIWLCSGRGDKLQKIDISQFDVLVIHYSLYCPSPHYITPKTRNKIKKFTGLKIAFVQDEYRRIDDEIAALSELKIDVLFSCFSQSEAVKIYSPVKLPGLKIFNTLTGYIPEHMFHQSLVPIKERSIDVGYRARKLGFWLGELGFEKWDIVEKWRKHASNADLITDISYKEEERMYGQEWLNFIKNCRVHLGVESGASVMDFTGELEDLVFNHMKTHPEDDFYKVQSLYFKDKEYEYNLNQISPRCFEAIVLKTALVLYEGEYSNILVPWVHYIPLKKDFSNIQIVIEKIKDHDFLQAMVDRTYQDIALNPEYHYCTFIEKFDAVVDAELKLRNKVQANHVSYSMKQFQSLINKKTLRTKITEIILRQPKFIRNVARFLYCKVHRLSK